MPSTMSEYKLKMKKIFNYLGGRCTECGSKTDLQVDHINHLEKGFTISSNWGRKWDVLEVELKKCQLLCKDHHLGKSKREGSLAKGWTNEPRQKHGTVWSYAKYGCRCEECKLAKSNERKNRLVKQGIV